MQKLYTNLFTRVSIDLRNRLDEYSKKSGEPITKIVEESLDKILKEKEARNKQAGRMG